MFPDISLGSFLLDLSSQARGNKSKNKQMGPKLKSFCTLKETINKIKKQPTEWEKIFANYMFDKGLIPEIYKELI